MSLFQKSAENITRHWNSAIPTVLVIAIVLTMLQGLLVIHSNAAQILKGLEQKFSITVYLKDDADIFEVGNMKNALESRDDIIPPVTYTSKEEAWKLLTKSFALDSELLQKYKFSLPASLTITPKNLSDVPKIEAFLETRASQMLKDPLITKNKQQQISQQLTEFVSNVKRGTLGAMIFFIIIFIIGGTLLLSSTIHAAISARHREIGIMKLVGASASSISLPFVIEGLIISALAFLVHLVLLAVIPFPGVMLGDPLFLNGLLFEFLGVMLLGGMVSHIAAHRMIKKNL